MPLVLHELNYAFDNFESSEIEGLKTSRPKNQELRYRKQLIREHPTNNLFYIYCPQLYIMPGLAFSGHFGSSWIRLEAAIRWNIISFFPVCWLKINIGGRLCIH
jgi:hypothetical protein